MRKDRKHPTPQEQMANVYDSLADDVVAGRIEIDEATTQRGSHLARAATEKALGSCQSSDALPVDGSRKEWVKRADKVEPPTKESRDR